MPDKTVSVNFPILGFLGLIFITLKLTNYIDWSWWIVLCPFWIPLALVLISMSILAIVAIYLSVNSEK